MKLINLNKLSLKERKKAKNLIKREWKDSDKQRGYKYKEENFEFIVEDKNQTIGSIKFQIVGGVAYLSELIIFKSYRNKGKGKELLSKFEEFARNKGCHAIYLQTSNKHKEALILYKKNRYKKFADVKDFIYHLNGYFFYKRFKS